MLIQGRTFLLITIIHWHNLPRAVVKSPSLEAFKMQLDRVLANLI